jgi:FixJ family two-component response regulator
MTTNQPDFTSRLSALNPTEQEALEEAVRDVASQQASNAINSSEEVEFLLAAGWTQDQIRKLLDDAKGRKS